MKNIEILISTMNQSNSKELISKMKILDKYIIINQIPNTNIELPKKHMKKNMKFLSYHEKGLSKSRNIAIKNASSDICLISDDDMYYEKNLKKIVLDAYEKYVDADIIVFDVDNEEKAKRKKILKEGKINLFKSMKISSVQITFKRKSIIEKEIKFKENFGAGAKYEFGEENIFLAECLRKGLKIYYIPKKIATLYKDEKSTWSREQTEEHYNIQGVVYYEISKKLYPLLILQFAIRKRNIYKEKITMLELIEYMFQGVRKYKKEENIK